MAKWRKRFAAWATAKQPVSVEEVESLIYRVFDDRVRRHDGGSHRWRVDVDEIKEIDDDFSLGTIGFPIKGGKAVKTAYLRIAYRAAVLLDLFQDDEDEQDDED